MYSNELGTPQAISKDGIAQQVIDQILLRIRTGELKPGQKLSSERELSREFGVGRPSLREALRALALLGALEIRQGEGVFVSELTPERLLEPLNFYLSLNDNSMEQLFEARIVIEAGMAGIAARKLDKDELRILERCVEEGEPKLGDAQAFLELDVLFHQTIVRAARNPFLERVAVAMHSLTMTTRALTAALPEIRQQAHRDHKAVFEALLYRDGDGASSAMASHLGGVWSRYRQLHDKTEGAPGTLGGGTPFRE